MAPVQPAGWVLNDSYGTGFRRIPSKWFGALVGSSLGGRFIVGERVQHGFGSERVARESPGYWADRVGQSSGQRGE